MTLDWIPASDVSIFISLLNRLAATLNAGQEGDHASPHGLLEQFILALVQGLALRNLIQLDLLLEVRISVGHMRDVGMLEII